MIDKADYSLIPERIMINLTHYVEGKEVPGGFLYSVLSNNLFRSIGKADREMLPLIPVLVHYIHWELPGNCHGSEEVVNKWIETHIYKQRITI